MRKGLFTLLSLVCAGLIWAAPAPANAADKIVIRFAHSNTPSDMDPYHALVTKMNDKLVEHRQYIKDNGVDLPEVRAWKWNDGKGVEA